MLDTNIVSDLIRNPAGKAAGRLATLGQDQLCVSIITACELRFGAAKSKSIRMAERVEAILARIPVLPLGPPADLHYGRIRTELAATGRLIGPNGLLIASHAAALGAVVVTANAGEFERVRDLRIENWLA